MYLFVKRRSPSFFHLPAPFPTGGHGAIRDTGMIRGRPGLAPGHAVVGRLVPYLARLALDPPHGARDLVELVDDVQHATVDLFKVPIVGLPAAPREPNVPLRLLLEVLVVGERRVAPTFVGGVGGVGVGGGVGFDLADGGGGSTVGAPLVLQVVQLVGLGFGPRLGERELGRAEVLEGPDVARAEHVAGVEGRDLDVGERLLHLGPEVLGAVAVGLRGRLAQRRAGERRRRGDPRWPAGDAVVVFRGLFRPSRPVDGAAPAAPASPGQAE